MKADADQNKTPLPTLPPEAANDIHENLKAMEIQFCELLKKLCRQREPLEEETLELSEERRKLREREEAVG